MNCGRLLNVFCEHMNEKDVIEFVHDVISHNFFLDLLGDPCDLARALPDIEDSILALLEKNKYLIEESDEDENGNLKDFIVDDDSIEQPRKLLRTS